MDATITTPTVLDALRGDRATRPRVDTGIAAGLRERLNDGLYEITGSQRPTTTLCVRASSMHQRAQTTDLSTSLQGRLRGVLVSTFLRLYCVGFESTNPFEDAQHAWRSSSPSDPLIADLDALEADDRARLAANVAAHCSTLRRSLGPVYEHWAPRTAVRSVVRLAGGVGELHDTIDLLIGSTRDDVASTALLDVTTAPLGPPNERTMRFHALVHTLRSTRTPLRVGTLSSATGEFWIRDVDAPALNVAVDELLQVFAALWVRP